MYKPKISYIYIGNTILNNLITGACFSQVYPLVHSVSATISLAHNYQLGHYKCTAPRKHSRANQKVGRTESPGQLNARCLYTTRFPRDMNNLSATDIGIIASKIDTGWETAFSDYLTRLVSPTSHLFYPNLKEHLVQLHRCCSDLNVRVNFPRELIIYIYIQADCGIFIYLKYKISFTKLRLKERRNLFFE